MVFKTVIVSKTPSVSTTTSEGASVNVSTTVIVTQLYV